MFRDPERESLLGKVISRAAESFWNLVLELCHALSKYYYFEDAKIAAVCPIFRRLLGEEIFRITFSQGCQTDGSVANTAIVEQLRVRGHELHLVNLDFKMNGSLKSESFGS